MTEVRLLVGDCREKLRELPDESVSCVITDPPYGLSKEPDAAEVMRHWLAGDDYIHKSPGFMQARWDSFCPGPATWREVYRVMKPGAFLLCFSGTRTWDLMSMAIRLAGFENRDTISHWSGPPALAWVQGQGFPKGLAIDKAIDKLLGAKREVLERRRTASGGMESLNKNNAGHGYRPSTYSDGENVLDVTAPATEEAKRWSGWNVALKPSWEVILVFRRPLSERSVAANVLRWNCGALNIDATRVGNGKDRIGGGLSLRGSIWGCEGVERTERPTG